MDDKHRDCGQSNTDGLFMKVENEELVQVIKEKAAEWERRTNLDLEWEQFDRIYQKDVNSYVIIKNDGSYKAKGSYLKKLSNLDYDLPILNKAVVNYFVHGTPIVDTILECDDLREFQKIVKVTGAYDEGAWKDCTFSEKKVQVEGTNRTKKVTVWNEDGAYLKDKTFRVFASLRDRDGGIYKKKSNKNPEKFANTPDKCFINNDNVLEKKVPLYLDKLYYIEAAQERINQILGIPKKPKKQVEEVKK